MAGIKDLMEAQRRRHENDLSEDQLKELGPSPSLMTGAVPYNPQLYAYAQRLARKNYVPTESLPQDSGPERFLTAWSMATPAQRTRERFLKSRDTGWAQEFGGVAPFYPTQRYIDQNLAPELGVPKTAIEALAQANQIARKNKLMSPGLADKMLPTLLTEGASGVNGWGYPDTPPYREILRKAGLPEDSKQLRQSFLNPGYDSDLNKAKLMHAVMAAKAMNYGEDKAVERWNGEGRAHRGPYLYADAQNHARKVAEAQALLSHPKNAEMKSVWDSYLDRYKGGEPLAQATETPWEPDKSYDQTYGTGYLGDAYNAVLGAPGKALHAVQDTVRNATAYSAGGFVDKAIRGGKKLL